MNIEQRYEKKVKKLKDRKKEERSSLRYQKLIAEIAQRIVKNDTKILKDKDYEEIALNLYGRTDKITKVRIKNMTNTEIARKDINETIRAVLLKNKFDEDKILDLIKKAENSAKSTKDYLDIIKEMKDILIPAAPKVTIQEQRSYNYSDYRDNKPAKTTQSVKITTSQKDNNDVPEQDNDVSE